MTSEWSIEIFPKMFLKLIDILKAPYDNPSMLWVLIPIVLCMVIILAYSSRYRREGGDYLSALSNSVFLIFVSAHLLWYLTDEGIFGEDLRTSVVFLVVIVGASLIIIDFFHLLPAKTIYRFSSKAMFYFLAYIAVILTYTNIIVDPSHSIIFNVLTTVVALGVFYLIFQMIIITIRVYVPPAQDATEAIMSKTEDELQEIAHRGATMANSMHIQHTEQEKDVLDSRKTPADPKASEKPKVSSKESVNIDDLAASEHTQENYNIVEDDAVEEEKLEKRKEEKILDDPSKDSDQKSSGFSVFGDENQDENELNAFEEEGKPDETETVGIEGPEDRNPLLTAQFIRAGPEEEEDNPPETRKQAKKFKPGQNSPL